jgi:hypothetical protein
MPADFSNVILFDRPLQAARESPCELPRKQDVSCGGWLLRAGLKIVRLLLAAVCGVLFVALMWLRWPLQLVCRFVAGASLLTIPLLWLGMPEAAPLKSEMLMTLIGVGLGTTALIWGYDRVLMRLLPGSALLVDR